MSKRDCYEVLGVSRDASADEIKKTYRRLAMKYHPDRTAGDAASEEKFKEVKEAYEILADSSKRALYDRAGHEGLESLNSGGFRSGGANVNDVFGDVFSDIFGGGRASSNRPKAGASLRFPLEITLEEAFYGFEKEIEIPRLSECSDCDGSGARKGTTPKVCPDCEGTGQLRMQQGFFVIQQTCGRCHGEGSSKEPCRLCRGKGRIETAKLLNIKIPEGVDDGDRVRITGEGEEGYHGGPSGDLYVEISLKKHALFERDGNDLHCEIPVPFVCCVLGGEVEVPCLDGTESLKISAETQSGKVFRLKKKGIKSVRSNIRGDLFCKILVDTPIELNQAQKSLLRKFDESLNQKPQQHFSRTRKSWLENAKKFFTSPN